MQPGFYRFTQPQRIAAGGGLFFPCGRCGAEGDLYGRLVGTDGETMILQQPGVIAPVNLALFCERCFNTLTERRP